MERSKAKPNHLFWSIRGVKRRDPGNEVVVEGVARVLLTNTIQYNRLFTHVTSSELSLVQNTYVLT